MTNIFDFKDYKLYILKITSGTNQQKIAKSHLAQAIGCQAAYLSQVLKGKAELTEDHGIKLCQFLHFSELETEYFLTILRMNRAGSSTLARYLEKSCQRLINLNKEVEQRIPSQKRSGIDELNIYYCSSWIPTLIHTATSCEAYQSVSSLCDRFHLDKETVELHLNTLQKFGLVEFKNNRWQFSGGSLHFPKGSPLEQSFLLQQRLFTLNKIGSKRPSDIHFSTVFASSPETIDKLRQLFFETIASLHEQVEPSPSQEVYMLCLDFYQT
jgi:hypothetical protein